MMSLNVRQITSGPAHHFFGYIGHCRTIPWNASGRWVLCLETDFQDRMPAANDAARVVLLDTENDYAPERVDESCGWNPQQGTMFYWNPDEPEHQFFFNDRDRKTGKIFTALYDIRERRRIREYRFDKTPVANGGVAQHGGSFMAINYGRMGRLRPVTGYPDASDWTDGVGAPEDDGIFRVDIETGQKELICSFSQMVGKLIELGELSLDDEVNTFINHTLWSRADDQILFYLRSGAMWGPGSGKDLNYAFTVRPDGSELTCHGYVGGHPEWAEGGKLIVAGEDGLSVYDVATGEYSGTIGTRESFFDPKGDKALSPDGDWLVHGNCVKTDGGEFHEYVLYRMSDGVCVTSPRFRRGEYTSGPLRLDPAPCWNRDATRVLVPGIADDGTRQLFVIAVVQNSRSES